MSAGIATAVPRPSAYDANGRVFPFDEDYFAALSAVRPLDRVARLPIFAGAALETHKSRVDDVGFAQFLGKLYEAALLLDVLRAAGRRPRFARALDIGSGPALQARMLKRLGIVDRAEAIDIYDGSARCSERLLRRHSRKLRVLYTGFRARRAVPGALRARVPKLRAIERKFPLGVEEFGYRPDQWPYRARLGGGASLDRYHVGDVFELAGAYDLVTSFMALDYFPFDRIAAKAASLLEPNGIFAFLVSYWWYPVNNTLLYGRFPYLLQQLRTDEVLEYYRRVHPELPLEGIRERLGYSDQSRPTIADYERIAWDHGLAPVRSLRLHPDHTANPRAVRGPLAIDRLPEWPLARVADNARAVNPRVGIADLMTSHVLMAFEKRA